MEKVRIPAKVLLDAMMQQLGLSNVVYSTQKARTIGLDATIQLYPSKHQLSNGLPKKSISIYVYGKLKDAEDPLANEALKYMKASYIKVGQDHNYDKLQLNKKKSLQHELKKKEGIIDYLSGDWCNGLGGDRTTVQELYRIIGSTPEDNNLNHTQSHIRYVAGHLNEKTLQSKHIPEETNKYYWGLDDDMEGISAFHNGSPPETPPMKSYLDDEVIFIPMARADST
ncbi:3-oxoacyl-(acyl-carrier-protein) reductase 3, chloroplastic [Hordeum vulgare]|nr:3-oxoacyl-(acyl-carrier-protein) reductase 3, chloroplastic [Hordeum vulgare]